MNEHDDELRHEIQSRTDSLPVSVPSAQQAMAAGRRRHRISIALTTCAALVIALGVALPLRALGHLGEDAPPRPVGPVTPTMPERIYLSTLSGPDDPGRIYTMAPDGSDVVRLTEGDADYSSVSISPDGTRMAYVKFVREADTDEPGAEGIFVAGTDGSSPSEVFASPEQPISIGDLEWSPDGGSVAFVLRTIPEGGSSEAEWTYRLWMVGADGADPHPVSEEQITSFAWSPQGDGFAVSVETLDGDRLHEDLYKLSLDGSLESRLTSDGTSHDPVWSPDGRRLAYTHGWGSAASQVSIMALDGSDAHALEVDWQGWTEPIAWSPDSSLLLVRGGNDQHSCVTLSVASDGETSTLLQGVGPFGVPLGTSAGDPCVQSASWSAGTTPTSSTSGAPTSTGAVVEMPNVMGVPIQDAIAILEAEGLVVGTIAVTDDSKLGEPGADEVIAQDPAAGNELDAGTEVSLTVTAMVHSMPSPTVDPERVGIYEAMIRELADPDVPGDILVDPELCSMLLTDPDKTPCDRLSRPEQQDLSTQLADLGTVRFSGSEVPRILLGPIQEHTDGARVEGGVICGGLCGSGTEYIVVPDGAGYSVAGKDPSAGEWIA